MNLPANLPNVPSSVSNEVSTEPLFTTRLQIVHPNSKVLVEWDSDDRPPSPGDLWLGPPGGTNLGSSVAASPLAQRDHALQLNGSEVALESFKRSATGSPPKDVDEEIFRKIEASPKDPTGKRMNHVGKDILFYLPEWKTFTILFFKGTARPQAAMARQYFPSDKSKNFKKCRITSQMVQGRGTQRWWIPVVTLDGDGLFAAEDNLPTPKQLMEELTKFLNPLPKGEGRDLSR